MESPPKPGSSKQAMKQPKDEIDQMPKSQDHTASNKRYSKQTPKKQEGFYIW